MKIFINQNGNILFIILIAIGLFALLGSVVMDGESTTNKISEDKAKIYAQDIISYANAMETAVQNMLARGVSETDLCFDFDTYPGGNDDYEYSRCSEEQNRVFHPLGGGAKYITPPPEYFDTAFISDLRTGKYIFSAAAEVYNLPRTTELNDTELLLFAYGLKKSVCVQINNYLNVGIKNDEPITEISSMAPGNSSIHFKGSYTASTYDIGSSGLTELHGVKMACVKGGSGGNFENGYVLYAVLHAR